MPVDSSPICKTKSIICRTLDNGAIVGVQFGEGREVVVVEQPFGCAVHCVEVETGCLAAGIDAGVRQPGPHSLDRLAQQSHQRLVEPPHGGRIGLTKFLLR